MVAVRIDRNNGPRADNRKIKDRMRKGFRAEHLPGAVSLERTFGRNKVLASVSIGRFHPEPDEWSFFRAATGSIVQNIFQRTARRQLPGRRQESGGVEQRIVRRPEFEAFRMLLEILRIGGHPQMLFAWLKADNTRLGERIEKRMDDLRHAGRQEPVFATPHGLDIKALGAERDVERTRTIAREGAAGGDRGTPGQAVAAAPTEAGGRARGWARLLHLLTNRAGPRFRPSIAHLGNGPFHKRRWRCAPPCLHS